MFIFSYWFQNIRNIKEFVYFLLDYEPSVPI